MPAGPIAALLDVLVMGAAAGEESPHRSGSQDILRNGAHPAVPARRARDSPVVGRCHLLKSGLFPFTAPLLSLCPAFRSLPMHHLFVSLFGRWRKSDPAWNAMRIGAAGHGSAGRGTPGSSVPCQWRPLPVDRLTVVG